jgi:hypothetical protein
MSGAPALLCWGKTSEANAGGITVEVEPSLQQSVSFVAARQMAAEDQFGKMASDTEMRTSRGVTFNSSMRKKTLHSLTSIDAC